MRDMIIEAACIALVFALAKYAELKYIKKTPPDTKAIMKDTVLVCLSAAGALTATAYLGVGAGRCTPTQAFTGKPEF